MLIEFAVKVGLGLRSRFDQRTADLGAEEYKSVELAQSRMPLIETSQFSPPPPALRQTAVASPSKVKTLPAVTSLRFVLAMLVVLIHCDNIIASNMFHERTRIIIATIVVPCFFCLSGFVLAYRYQKFEGWRALAQFAAARVARIVPVWFFILALFLAVVPLPSFGIKVSECPLVLLSNIFLVQSWTSLPQFCVGIDPPAYSLSEEVFFYFLFPLFVLFAPGRRILLWLGACALISFLIFSLAEHRPQWGYYQQIFPPSHIVDFLIGVIAGRMFLKWREITLPQGIDNVCSTVLEVVCCATLVWWTLSFGQSFAQDWNNVSGLVPFLRRIVAIVLFALLCMSFGRQKGLLSNLFAYQLPVILGESSYALFLLHSPLLRIGVQYKWDWNLFGLPALACFIIMALSASYLCYKWVEKPWRTAIVCRQFSYKRGVVLIPLIFVIVAGCSLVWDCVSPPTEVADTRNIAFGESAILQKLYCRRAFRGLVLTGYWHALDKPDKDTYLAVHVVDNEGEILCQYDHLLYSTAADQEWYHMRCDEFFVPQDQLNAAAAIGLTVFTDSKQASMVYGGHSDWGHHRLIIPLRDL
jgi:peptidoglycan/LPS O-acetylase OafA/YrhL